LASLWLLVPAIQVRVLAPQSSCRFGHCPPREQLIEEIAATSYLAVGRKYGVSDTAVRKWVRFYERQAERERREREGEDPSLAA
jgi:hypothetical protein